MIRKPASGQNAQPDVGELRLGHRRADAAQQIAVGLLDAGQLVHQRANAATP